jgi:hypothetical protein
MRLERLVRDNNPSILGLFVGYEEKHFMTFFNSGFAQKYKNGLKMRTRQNTLA